MNNRLQEKTWQEAAELIKISGGVAIIPVGSVEQHGYHLPLGTDSYVAISLAEAAAERTNVLVTPPVWYGWCPHHLALPGSVSIRAEILIELLYDIISSLSLHGVKKFVVLNGHRIVNIAWMSISAEKAQRQLGVTVKIFDPGYMSKSLIASLNYGPLGHAEEIETSQMLHCYPDMVHMDRAKDNPIPPPNLYSPDPSYGGDTLCYVPLSAEDMQHSIDAAGGTSGRPTKATAENGKIYFEHLLGHLITVIEGLKK